MNIIGVVNKIAMSRCVEETSTTLSNIRQLQQKLDQQLNEDINEKLYWKRKCEQLGRSTLIIFWFAMYSSLCDVYPEMWFVDFTFNESVILYGWCIGLNLDSNLYFMNSLLKSSRESTRSSNDDHNSVLCFITISYWILELDKIIQRSCWTIQSRRSRNWSPRKWSL